MKRLLLCLALLALPVLFAHAQQKPPLGAPAGPPQARRPPGGPFNHKVLSASSRDGLTWTRDEGVRLEHASLPCSFVAGDRVFFCRMYFKVEERTAAMGPPPQPGGQPGRPAPGQAGPWDQDVLVHRVSKDGTAERLATFERSGVPAIARMKDGRLIAAHQHFPENDPGNFDKVAVRFSENEGRTWIPPQVVQVAGLPEGMRFPFDPTLVPLPDGRVRLYFTSLRGRTFEQDMPVIFSAISSDGLRYTVEPGVRFAVAGRPVIDCAVVLHKGVFHLFSPDNGTQLPMSRGGNPPDVQGPPPGTAYHATGRDGLLFTREDDVRISGNRRWLGSAQSDGEMITFFGTGAPGPAPALGPPGPGRGGVPAGGPRGGVWRATSEDGVSWKLLEEWRVPGADPGAVSTKDGAWIVVSTGPPRPGKPSARRGRLTQQGGS